MKRIGRRILISKLFESCTQIYSFVVITKLQLIFHVKYLCLDLLLCKWKCAFHGAFELVFFLAELSWKEIKLTAKKLTYVFFSSKLGTFFFPANLNAFEVNRIAFAVHRQIKAYWQKACAICVSLIGISNLIDIVGFVVFLMKFDWLFFIIMECVFDLDSSKWGKKSLEKQ